MKITVTVKEIMDKGCWEEFCILKGINKGAVNEGLMDTSEEFSLYEEHAKDLGLLENSSSDFWD